MRQFKIQGEFDGDDQDFLYWSNDLGWVDFESATVFNADEINYNMPMGTKGIAILDETNTCSVEEARRKLS